MPDLGRGVKADLGISSDGNVTSGSSPSTSFWAKVKDLKGWIALVVIVLVVGVLAAWGISALQKSGGGGPQSQITRAATPPWTEDHTFSYESEGWFTDQEMVKGDKISYTVERGEVLRIHGDGRKEKWKSGIYHRVCASGGPAMFRSLSANVYVKVSKH